MSSVHTMITNASADARYPFRPSRIFIQVKAHESDFSDIREWVGVTEFRAMATYHLYYLQRGMLVGSDELDAVDDDEAERLAASGADGRTVELWSDYRRLRVIAPKKPGRRSAFKWEATDKAAETPLGAVGEA